MVWNKLCFKDFFVQRTAATMRIWTAIYLFFSHTKLHFLTLTSERETMLLGCVCKYSRNYCTRSRVQYHLETVSEVEPIRGIDSEINGGVNEREYLKK